MGFLSSNYRPSRTYMCSFWPYLASAKAAQHYYSPWRTLLFILNVFCEYRVPCRVRHAPKRATCLWPVLPCRYPFDMQAASLRPLILLRATPYRVYWVHCAEYAIACNMAMFTLGRTVMQLDSGVPAREQRIFCCSCWILLH